MAGATGKRSILIEVLGDYKNFIAGGGKAEMAVKSFEQRLQAAGRALTLAYGAKKVVDWTAGAVKAAAEDAAAQTMLAQTLRATTGARRADIASMEAWITDISHATGYLDDDLRPAVAVFARVTNDSAKAQQLLRLAMDVSRGSGKDLETVTAAIAKAYTGNTTALGRLIPGIRTAGEKTLSWADAQQKLNAQFGGQAAAFAGTAEGKIARLNAQYQDMKETVGAALLPVVSQLVGVLSEVFGWFDRLNPAQQQVIVTAGLLAGALYVGVSAFNAVKAAVMALGLTMEAVNPWLAGAALAVGALTVVVGLFGGETDTTTERAKQFYGTVAEGVKSIDMQRLAFMSATDAAAEYSDTLYESTASSFRTDILEKYIDEMHKAGITVADLDKINRGAADGMDAYSAAHAKLLAAARKVAPSLKGLSDTYIAEASNADDLSASHFDLITAYKALDDKLREHLHVSDESVQSAIERARVGDLEAAAWLKATGNLDQLNWTERLSVELSLRHAQAQQDLAGETSQATTRFKDQLTALQNLWTAMRAQIDSEFGLRSAQRDATEAMDDYTKVVKNKRSTTADIAEAADRAEEAFLRQADAAVKLAEDQAKAAGGSLSAQEKNLIWVQSIREAADAMAPGSPVRVYLEQLAEQFMNFPDKKVASLTFETHTVAGSRTVRAYASGTRNAPPGMAWTGERGPELIEFAGGERVHTAAESARIMRPSQLAAAAAPSSAGLTQVGPFHITVADQATAREIVDESTWAWRMVF